MRRQSLAFRLTALLGVAWLAFFLVLGAVVWHTTVSLARQAEADKTRALANQLAVVSLDAVLQRDYGTLERYLSDLSEGLAYAEIRRSDGQVLGYTGALRPGLDVVRETMRVRGDGLDEAVGEVIVQYDPAPARRAAWQLAAILALGLALFAGFTFWALRRLILGQVVAPVAALIDGADPERPLPALPPGAPQEVADLGGAIAELRQRIGRHMAEAEDAAQARNEALRRLCSEQRLASVGQIAGEVAHELNTPLSNILGYAQSALPDATDPELREALETIEGQARRAGQIVRDMLTAVRAPAPSRQSLDLAELARAFVRMVTPLARKQGAVLMLEGLDLLVVEADPARVEQILFNLSSNAVQAGATELRLAVLAEPVPTLAFSDNGPGLPGLVRARLFEPFVTTKPAGQGTGLGLAISQRLAREMKAELVWIDNTPGTRFELRFAAEEAES